MAPSDLEKVRELIDLSALDLLGPDEQKLLACLASWDESTKSEIAGSRRLVSRIALSLPSAAPSPSLKARLMDRVQTSVPTRGGFEQAAEGIEILRAGSGRWRATPFPGVSFQLLHLDRETGQQSQLVRIEPKGVYPVHRHAGVEQTYVLEGSCRIGTVQLSAGDYQRAAAGLVHDAIETDTGCVALLVSSRHDEIVSTL